jgi:hypothetical protein
MACSQSGFVASVIASLETHALRNMPLCNRVVTLVRVALLGGERGVMCGPTDSVTRLPCSLRRFMHIFQRTGPNAVSNVGLELAAVDDGPLCGLQGTMTVLLPAGSYVATKPHDHLNVNSDMIVSTVLC